MDEETERLKQRLAEGSRLARSLIGLTRETAVSRVAEMGFDPQVIPSTAEAVSADLRGNRLRIVVDEAEQVVDAWAG